jgi:hypothetical protein
MKSTPVFANKEPMVQTELFTARMIDCGRQMPVTLAILPSVTYLQSVVSWAFFCIFTVALIRERVYCDVVNREVR